MKVLCRDEHRPVQMSTSLPASAIFLVRTTPPLAFHFWLSMKGQRDLQSGHICGRLGCWLQLLRELRATTLHTEVAARVAAADCSSCRGTCAADHVTLLLLISDWGLPDQAPVRFLFCVVRFSSAFCSIVRSSH